MTLTRDRLEQLATRWRDQHVPIIESLRPGLSDDEMDKLTKPLGLTLPREARTWWAWHDGASTDAGGSANMGPLRLYSPLASAVQATVEIREIMRGVNGELDTAWRHSWLTLNSGGNTTVIDCGVGYEEPVPARSFIFEEPEVGSEGVASLGVLVSLYIEAFDRGVWAYDTDRGVWCGNASKSDPASRNLHLI